MQWHHQTNVDNFTDIVARVDKITIFLQMQDMAPSVQKGRSDAKDLPIPEGQLSDVLCTFQWQSVYERRQKQTCMERSAQRRKVREYPTKKKALWESLPTCGPRSQWCNGNSINEIRFMYIWCTHYYCITVNKHAKPWNWWKAGGESRKFWWGVYQVIST